MAPALASRGVAPAVFCAPVSQARWTRVFGPDSLACMMEHIRAGDPSVLSVHLSGGDSLVNLRSCRQVTYVHQDEMRKPHGFCHQEAPQAYVQEEAPQDASPHSRAAS